MSNTEIAKANQPNEPKAECNELAALRLGPDQQAAMESLLMGKSIAETSRTAGVSRMAIYRWLKHDAEFRAAFNQWQDHLRESCRSRLQALTDKAADAVEKALEAGDARAALQLLKGLGMLKEHPPEPTDPMEVRSKLAAEEKRKEFRIRREAARLADEEILADTGF